MPTPDGRPTPVWPGPQRDQGARTAHLHDPTLPQCLRSAGIRPRICRGARPNSPSQTGCPELADPCPTWPRHPNAARREYSAFGASADAQGSTAALTLGSRAPAPAGSARRRSSRGSPRPAQSLIGFSRCLRRAGVRSPFSARWQRLPCLPPKCSVSCVHGHRGTGPTSLPVQRCPRPGLEMRRRPARA